MYILKQGSRIFFLWRGNSVGIVGGGGDGVGIFVKCIG